MFFVLRAMFGYGIMVELAGGLKGPDYRQLFGSMRAVN